MSTILIVDTSVLMNVLDVPGFNQDRDTTLGTLQKHLDDRGIHLLLPFASIIETGNHIAHLSDGRQRRKYAKIFCDQVQYAIDGIAPWTPTRPIELIDLRNMLANYPDMAMRGVGFGDLSIIREWELACERNPRHRIQIWTLDRHLSSYDSEDCGF